MRTESICATAQPAEGNGDVAGEMATPLRINGSQYVSGRRARLVWAVITLARRYANLDLIMTVGERRIDMSAGGIDLAVCIGDLKVDPNWSPALCGCSDLVICAAPDNLSKAHR